MREVGFLVTRRSNNLFQMDDVWMIKLLQNFDLPDGCDGKLEAKKVIDITHLDSQKVTFVS